MTIVEMVAAEKKFYPSVTLFIHPDVRLSLCWRLELGTSEDTKYMCVCACVCMCVYVMLGEEGIIAYICYS